jgi:hypothetical protein
MLIIAVSGRKQSGKSTSGNFIYAIFMAQLGVADKVLLDEEGNILISDLFGDKTYEGVFDISNTNVTDININKVFAMMHPQIRIYNFADALKKNLCMNMLGLSYQQCYGSDNDKNTLTNIQWSNMPGYDDSWTNRPDYDLSGFMTARQVMEFVGTDIFRKMKQDVWAQATLNKIHQDRPGLAIITDCRFPNEVDAIKSSGGKVIRLTRDPFQSTHISECILDKDNYDWSNFDYVLDNQNYSLYEKSVELKKIVEEILQL